MASDHFPLFPSEAVLIGRLFAEWEPPSKEELPNYDGPIFFEFLNEGLRPLVLDQTLIRQRCIDRKDIPADVEWSDLEKCREGISKEKPNVLYREEAERLLEIRYDDSRKSLIDLLAEYLSGHLAMSVVDFIRYNTNSGRGMAFAVSLSAQLAEQNVSSHPVGTDDCEQIERLLKTLAAANALSDEYELGVVIGRILASITCCKFELENSSWLCGYDQIINQDKWSHPLPLSPRHLHQVMQPLLTKLIANCQDRLSSSVLTILKHYCIEDRFASVSDAKALSSLKSLQEAILMTLGQVLVALQSADVLAREKDISSIYPRSLRSLPRLSPDAASERVGGMVLGVRQLLVGNHPAMIGPESLLAMVAGGVEATVRDVWPDVGRAGRNNSELASRLDEKAGRGNDQEKRFAHLARHLMKQYRNPATHELNTMECSWSELQHFIHGLNALREMAAKLKRNSM